MDESTGDSKGHGYPVAGQDTEAAGSGADQRASGRVQDRFWRKGRVRGGRPGWISEAQASRTSREAIVWRLLTTLLYFFYHLFII